MGLGLLDKGIAMNELERLKKEAADAWRVAGVAVAAAAEDAAVEDAAWRAVEEAVGAWRAAAFAADAAWREQK